MNEREQPLANDDLVKAFATTVDVFARSVQRQYACTQFEDLRQVGNEALVKARAAYDPKRETEFRTFAELKIRGAIIDEARRESRARRVRRSLEVATQEIQADGGEPTTAGSAAASFTRRIARILDDAFSDFVLADPGAGTPEAAYEDQETARRFEEGVAQLSPRVREYLQLHLREGLSNKQIAERWGVDKSTVSWARRTAEQSLQRIMLGDEDDGDADGGDDRTA